MWCALGRDYLRGSRESLGRDSPRLPSFNVRMPHCRDRVSLCWQNADSAVPSPKQVRRHIVPGIPTRSAEGASVVGGCNLLVRREVLGGTDDQSVSRRARFRGGSCSNRQHESGLTPNTYGFPARSWTVPAACWILQLHFRRGANTWGLPAPFLGRGCAMSRICRRIVDTFETRISLRFSGHISCGGLVSLTRLPAHVD